MSTYRFMEYSVNQPNQRNNFLPSREVINLPFKKENRFKEFWRSMFLYRSEKPQESDPMFGNFYLECDIPDFHKNKSIILEATDYIQSKYKIPSSSLEFFLTNRSLWLTIPAKVFGSFGSIKLNMIYKKMAEEIQGFLNEKGFSNPLDTTIYKWNGLIHSLGSYLHNSKRWVTKFTLSDLEDSYTMEDLIHAKFDNFYDSADIQVVSEASEWYQNIRNQVLFSTKEKPSVVKKKRFHRPCMKKLEDLGFVEEDRNLHMYSYALHLKDLGYSTAEAIAKIQEVFNRMDYVFLPECERTIRSAIEGTKRFNYPVVREILNPDLFTDEDNYSENEQEKDTFIFPRDFISTLQKGKAHYDTYKYLTYILHAKQNFHKDFSVSLEGEKYKQLVISRYKKLEDLNIAKVLVSQNTITCSLIRKEHSTYKSHIVIPNTFLHDKRFINMKSEIKVLFELWRSSILSGHKKKTVSFNVKWKTISQNIQMSNSQLMKALSILRKLKLVFANRLFVFFGKKQIKEQIKRIVGKIQSKVNKNKVTIHPRNNEIPSLPENRVVESFMKPNQLISGFLSIL